MLGIRYPTKFVIEPKELGDANVRQLKEDGTLFMLKRIKCPGILLEAGYITNWAEAQLLNFDEYQQRLVDAIIKGVMRYLEIDYE